LARGYDLCFRVARGARGAAERPRCMYARSARDALSFGLRRSSGQVALRDVPRIFAFPFKEQSRRSDDTKRRRILRLLQITSSRDC